MRKINGKQVRLLQVARRKLGLEEADYRALLERLGGVASAKELAPEAFEAIMVHCRRLGFVSDAHRAAFGERAEGMARPGQVHRIKQAWDRFTGGAGTDASLNKWLEGRFKVSALRFLDDATAKKAITALNAMNARTAKPAPAAAE